MPRDSSDLSTHLSTSDFLSTLERSGVFSDTGLQVVRERLVNGGELQDPGALAEQLIEQGSLTEFQARRLLLGKSRGLVFGRYVLLDRLGIGAMGRVFKARHRLMDRIVALKVVLPLAVNSKHAVSRFFREMKIVGLLDHPNVVRAFDADQFEDSPYIVMEYLEGEDLEKTIQRREMLPPREVIDYMLQAAWGLAHAHEKGVVHRDIKPTNLFLSSTGVVKVLDLGLGAFVSLSNERVQALDTDEGYVVGTTDYMSPEQLSGEGVDARTDLFSLGCSMYRLLTGAYAFPGMTKMDRLVRRLQEPHVPVTEFRNDLPVPLIALLERTLALRPEDRFSSAIEVAEALEEMLPRAERPSRGSHAASLGKPSRTPLSSSPQEPEMPLDWSRIESALGPRQSRASETESSSSSIGLEPARPVPARLHSSRLALEQEGAESGRAVQQEYRKQVIQLNRDIVDQRAQDAESAPAPLAETWLERAGEHIGDFLAEPSAGHVILIIFAVALALALSLVYALR
jgi:serine/threonine-protein kinase